MSGHPVHPSTRWISNVWYSLLHHGLGADTNISHLYLQADQAGTVLPGPEPETGSIDVQGSYTFVADDGNTYSVSYQANEAGFQPEADFLPVAPAQIPEYAQLRQEHPELFWAESQQ